MRGRVYILDAVIATTFPIVQFEFDFSFCELPSKTMLINTVVRIIGKRSYSHSRDRGAVTLTICIPSQQKTSVRLKMDFSRVCVVCGVCWSRCQRGLGGRPSVAPRSGGVGSHPSSGLEQIQKFKNLKSGLPHLLQCLLFTVFPVVFSTPFFHSFIIGL
jgi:hypothetical protein